VRGIPASKRTILAMAGDILDSPLPALRCADSPPGTVFPVGTVGETVTNSHLLFSHSNQQLTLLTPKDKIIPALS